jgi:hypothetical protein
MLFPLEVLAFRRACLPIWYVPGHGAIPEVECELGEGIKAFLNAVHERPAYERALERGGGWIYAEGEDEG